MEKVHTIVRECWTPLEPVEPVLGQDVYGKYGDGLRETVEVYKQSVERVCSCSYDAHACVRCKG